MKIPAISRTRRSSLLTVLACALFPIASNAEDRWGGSPPANTPAYVADHAVELSFSDEPAAEGALHFHMDDEAHPVHMGESHYPNCVSYDPGHPAKPLIDRPGDRNRADCPPERYLQSDWERAGKPHCVAWWAIPPINKEYSACYVGGGTAWILPRHIRPRQDHEGTWGLDYDGLFRPRRVWLNWSCGREQGGLGAYETDGAPKIVEAISRRHE